MTFLKNLRSDFAVGDKQFTKWGITSDEFEPLEDNSKQCLKTCYDESNPDCDGSWRVESCDTQLNFVCQNSCKFNDIPTNLSYANLLMLLTDKCPEGWITYENSCYKLETSSNLKNLDQEGGLRHCKNTYNGILSVMNSREEADYLSNYVYGVSVSHHNNPFLYLHLPLCVSFIAIYHFTYQWNSIPKFGYRSHSQHKISGISRWYHHD